MTESADSLDLPSFEELVLNSEFMNCFVYSLLHKQNCPKIASLNPQQKNYTQILEVIVIEVTEKHEQCFKSVSLNVVVCE